MRDVEDLCREFGWRNVGPSADLEVWLRERLEKLERLLRGSDPKQAQPPHGQG